MVAAAVALLLLFCLLPCQLPMKRWQDVNRAFVCRSVELQPLARSLDEWTVQAARDRAWVGLRDRCTEETYQGSSRLRLNFRIFRSVVLPKERYSEFCSLGGPFSLVAADGVIFLDSS